LESYRFFSIIRQLRYLLALAFLGVAAFNTLIYKAMHYTTAINAVLVTSFIPILILIISSGVYKEKPTRIQLVGILVSIGGIAMILLKADINRLIQLSFNTGDLLVLMAALVWATYSVMLKSFPKDRDHTGFYRYCDQYEKVMFHLTL
jgi:drug/metabolite transporter (DMT)-like permease